jgi:hypothetical protein
VVGVPLYSKCLSNSQHFPPLSRLISRSETQSHPKHTQSALPFLRSSRDLCDCVCMRTKETPNCHLTLCRCCCSAISNSPLAPLTLLLLRLLLLSVTLFVPVTHNDMSLCACYTPIYIYIIIHALNHSHPTFALCASAPQKLTPTFTHALFPSGSLSISFSPRFGYFCTFVLNVCLCLSVCAWKSCVFASLFLSLSVCLCRAGSALCSANSGLLLHPRLAPIATSQQPAV